MTADVLFKLLPRSSVEILPGLTERFAPPPLGPPVVEEVRLEGPVELERVAAATAGKEPVATRFSVIEGPVEFDRATIPPPPPPRFSVVEGPVELDRVVAAALTFDGDGFNAAASGLFACSALTTLLLPPAAFVDAFFFLFLASDDPLAPPSAGGLTTDLLDKAVPTLFFFLCFAASGDVLGRVSV